MQANTTTPTCPKCQGATTLRAGKFGKFYSCLSYPRCKGTRPYAASTAPRTVASAAAIAAVVGSPEQVAIWDFIVNGKGHLVVQALAGTGKSFTCRHAMHLLPASTRTLYLAFNKAIADEFRATAPEHVTVSTINSLGYQVCRKAWKSRTDADKISYIVADVYNPTGEDAAQRVNRVTRVVETLVNLCQGYLIDPADTAALDEVMARHDIDADADVMVDALRLLPGVFATSKSITSVCSFSDQMYLPVVHGVPTPKFDVIFVDEAQDLNALQHKFVTSCLAAGGRLIVVGDANQAIYGFRGSDVDSIDNLSAMLDTPPTVLPLSYTRRCPQAVVKAANVYVADLKAMPDAPEGIVASMTPAQANEVYAPGDMVLSRVNAPLMSIALRIIRRGTKAVVRGRDVGKSLESVVRRLRADNLTDLIGKLEAWESSEVMKFSQSKNAATIAENIHDKAECIRAVVSDLPPTARVLDVYASIASIFADFEPGGAPRAAVVLSSIHRAKGLESDRVFWLDPERKTQAKQPWEIGQERNLKYVAITRSKRELVMVG